MASSGREASGAVWARVTSIGMRDFPAEYFPGASSQTLTACIAYGGNIETSCNPQIVRQYGLEPGNYYLIASRLVPENNAALIVEGFKKASTRRILAIAGDANYRSSFIDDLKANAGDRVKFLGHVSNIEHVKELHCNCYAYIHGHMMGGTNPALLKALGFGNY